MDRDPNAESSMDEDGGMEASILSESTVRGGSYNAAMPPFDVNYAWSNYSESLESSEHYYGQSHHALTASSVTSDTPINQYSFVYTPYDQISPTGPVASQETVLQGITGGSSIDPATLERYGSKNMDVDLSAASSSLERNAETSALIGLTGAEARVPQPPSGDHGLIQTLRDFNAGYYKVLGVCSPDDVRQAKQNLALLLDHLNAVEMSQSSLTVPLPNSIPPSSNGSLTVIRYKCPDCDKCDTTKRGTFTRHVNDQHHPKCMYICPHGCQVEKPRKYQLGDHIRLRHKREVTDEELDAYRRDNACPVLCPHCYVNIKSWKHFEQCYLVHCSYEASSNAAISSRRTSVDQGTVGRDDAPSTNQLQPGPNSSPAQAISISNDTPGTGGYPFSVHGGNGPTPHSTMPPGPSPDLPRGNASQNYPQRDAPHPTNTGEPTLGHRRPSSHQRGLPNRNAQNAAPRPSRRGPGPSCQRCSHRFDNCQECHRLRESTPFRHRLRTSTPFCHRCLEFPRILDMARANHGPQMGGPSQELLSFINPATLLNQGHQTQPILNHETQGQYPSGGVPEFSPYGGMAPGLDGQQRNYRTMPVLGLDEPLFSEFELAWPSVLDLKATSVNGTLLKMLPMIDLDPFKKWLCKPLQGLGSLALSGLDFVTQFDPPSSKVAMVNPDCQCKCACRAKARAELASGRKVEMKFKLRPVYRGTSHLRSRVEIVVKLLKLRSSVTESKAKREEDKSAITQAFEPTLIDRANETPDYESGISNDSAAEPVFDEDGTDALSTSSSYADLQTLVPAKPSSSAPSEDPSDNSLLSFKDDKIEENDTDILIEFNFDLGVALAKLGRYTGGSSMDIFSDLCISDPGRLFEYLTAYILYVIVSLAHSRDHSGLRRLDS